MLSVVELSICWRHDRRDGGKSKHRSHCSLEWPELWYMEGPGQDGAVKGGTLGRSSRDLMETLPGSLGVETRR